MSEEHITRARLRLDGTVVQVMPDGTEYPFENKTDAARLEAMTEEEIEAGALSDPDNPPLSDEELKRFSRVPLSKFIRRRLGLTQEQFAQQFGFSVGAVRDWEQGIHQPEGAVKAYLTVIARNPQAVIQALEATDVRQR